MSENDNIRKYRGAMTALVTPFSEAGGVDYARLKSLLRYQLENGISGLIIAGTTGEGATLEESELLDLIAFTSTEVKGRVSVIAGCGSNSTSHAVRKTRKAAERGADAVLSVVPYYNRPSQDGLFEHFSAIADDGGLPVILYNVPGRTGANMIAATTARLAENPMIAGVKEASGDLRQIEEILSLCPADFPLFSGDDGLTYAIMALGGVGTISVTSNLLPAQVSSLVAAMMSSRLEEAMAIHKHLSPLNRALFIDTNPVPVKEAFDILGSSVGRPRLPLVRLDSRKREELTEILDDFRKEFSEEWSDGRGGSGE